MDLQQQAIKAFLETRPEEKGRLIEELQQHAMQGASTETLRANATHFSAPGMPGKPRLVHPRDLKRRGSGTEAGRVALLHAIAHIEFNAMNLALDAAIRFAGLPSAYYLDWISVAADEARHFRLLEQRMRDFALAYGDHPAHQGLWDMALRTAHDPLDRMALVPRIMEARGLDVTPGMIGQFVRAGDGTTAEILGVILEEEVGHVEAGTRWFRFLCEQRKLEADATWFDRVSHYLGGDIRCPVNYEDRGRAGFRDNELEWLSARCRQGAARAS